MTLLDNQPTVSSHAYEVKKNTMGRTIVKWMTSTDPKVIGNLISLLHLYSLCLLAPWLW